MCSVERPNRSRGWACTCCGLLLIVLTLSSAPAATAQEKMILQGDNPIQAIAISPDGTLLATAGGTHKRTLTIWNLLTKRMVHRLDRGSEYVVALAFSADGKTLTSITGHIYKGEVYTDAYFWDLATGESRGGIEVEGAMLALGPAGRHFVTRPSAKQQIVKVWDAKTGDKAALEGHTGQVKHAAISADGKRIATVGGRPQLIVWEFPSGKKLWEREYEPFTVPQFLTFAPDGKTLLTARAPRSYLFDAGTGERLAWLPAGAEPQFSPDGKLIAYRGAEAIGLWSATKRQKLTVLRASGKDGMEKMAFSPDGLLLVTAGSGGTIRVWDVPQLLPGVFDGPPPRDKK